MPYYEPTPRRAWSTPLGAAVEKIPLPKPMEPDFENLYWKIVHAEERYLRTSSDEVKKLYVMKIRGYLMSMGRMEAALEKKHKPIPQPNPYRRYYVEL
jgi:hypothetical protein